MVLIFCFSAQNGDASSDASEGLLFDVFRVLMPHWETLSTTVQDAKLEAWHTLFRKCGHFTEYAVMGLLWTCYTRCEHWETNCKRWRIWLPFAVALLYAISDELHQLFVPGRSAEPRDVCIDFLGACTGILLLYVGRRMYRQCKKA